jgi:DNA-binding transcriptional MerR regulator
MASQSAQKRVASQTEIPDRLYYRIGDVARLCGVETYVLRFWETQFPQLKPNKGGTGQRLYRRRELDIALRIKQLVHEEGYTIAGARQLLDNGSRNRTRQSALQLTSEKASSRAESTKAALLRIRTELRELANQLAMPEPTVARRKARITTFRAPSATLFPE